MVSNRSENTQYFGKLDSRWLTRLIREKLEEYNHRKFVTIHFLKYLAEKDVLHLPGAQ